MKRGVTIVAAAAGAGLAGLCGTARAVDPVFTYQGVLLDGGSPAEGVYDVRFELFDVANGGAALAMQTFDNAGLVGGLFTGDLNFGVFLLPGENRWLRISIRPGASAGAFTALSPRQQVRASPHALHAETSDLLQTRFAAPNNGVLGVESAIAGQSGRVLIRRSDGTVLVDLGPGQATPAGGELALNDQMGHQTIYLDGGFSDQNVPSVVFIPYENSDAFFAFDAQNAAEFPDGAFQLHDGAVNAQEMFNEPGVGSATQPGAVSFGGTPTVLLSRTIVCPSQGYVLVIGTAEVILSHVNGSGTQVNFGVSDSAGAFPSTQDVDISLPASSPTGNYQYPATVHGLFGVDGEGSFTGYVLGSEDLGSASATDLQLTCVFIPTAYGTVMPTALGATGAGDRPGPTRQGLSPAEVLDELRSSEADYRASVEADLAEMRAQIEAMRRRLERGVDGPAAR